MMILCALLNGLLIALARILNARLAVSRNAFFASWINHFVGFLFLSILIFGSVGFPAGLTTVPGYMLMGGVVGALYVTLNSFIVYKLGVTQAALFVITGQLITSLLLDLLLGNIHVTFGMPLLTLFVGMLLLVFGFYQSIRST